MEKVKKVAFHTLGCKVNSYESEAMLELFKEAGYQEADFKDTSDVYIINTCTVTNTGDRKSRQIIRQAIKRNPDAVVCVVGCYAQVAKDEVLAIEGVGVIIGTRYKDRIVDLVNEHLSTGEVVVRIDDVLRLSEFEELEIHNFKNTRAFLKIQDGCNNFCTYCIIPYSRGKLRSRDRESVLAQARELVAKGFVEIVLTGIHTAGYGEDFGDYDFGDLLEELAGVPGLKRLRISSIETSQITDKIVGLISENKVIVDHLHVPIQAGSDEILKKMRRKYTLEQFESRIAALREKMPNMALSTDIIVGFPGETDELFEKTVETLKRINFMQLHVFPYSKRKNTPAARMADQVDEQIKKQRVGELVALSKELTANYARANLDVVQDVLFESREGDYLVGHSSNYLKIKVATDAYLIGQIVPVRLVNIDDELIGEIVK